MIKFTAVTQCSHKRPCDPPPAAAPETKWRSVQTIEAVMPPTWTRVLLEEFVEALAAQAGITDMTLVEFRGDPDTVSVSGNGHSLAMPLTFVPDDVLGPWLLSRREAGNIWSCVHRPQPRDRNGTVLAPLVTGGAR